MQGPAEARGKTMRNILSFSVKDVSLALVAWQQIDDIVERERGERERERGGTCWRSVQLAGEGWGNSGSRIAEKAARARLLHFCS